MNEFFGKPTERFNSNFVEPVLRILNFLCMYRLEIETYRLETTSLISMKPKGNECNWDMDGI